MQESTSGPPPQSVIVQLLKSKTVRVAILQAVAGILMAAVAVNPKLQALGASAVLKSLIDIALRMVTTEPIEAK